MTTDLVGRMYKVSDNAVRKWARKYRLPCKREDVRILRKNAEEQADS